MRNDSVLSADVEINVGEKNPGNKEAGLKSELSQDAKQSAFQTRHSSAAESGRCFGQHQSRSGTLPLTKSRIQMSVVRPLKFNSTSAAPAPCFELTTAQH